MIKIKNELEIRRKIINLERVLVNLIWDYRKMDSGKISRDIAVLKWVLGE